MKIEFITSAANMAGWPKSDLPEVALAGRSNAGKSSFLNALAGRPVAKVSQVPGKTRLLNFFSAGEHYRWVDMPGYGFAARSGAEMTSWGPLIESYLRERERLMGVLLFIDVRRDWSDEETQIQEFLATCHRSLLVVVTKMDKLSRTDLARRRKHFVTQVEQENLFIVSNQDLASVKSVENFIFRQWIKGGL